MMELSPCPFCGSKDLKRYLECYERNGILEKITTSIECLECGASGPKIGVTKKIIWNDRIDFFENNL